SLLCFTFNGSRTYRPLLSFPTRRSSDLVWDYIVNTQVWRSIMRHGYPNTPRNRSLAVLANLVLHLHPIRLRKSGLQVQHEVRQQDRKSTRLNSSHGSISYAVFCLKKITK